MTAEKIVQNIIDYIDYLKTLGLQVSFCDPSGRWGRFYRELVPYNNHACEFCSFIKSNKTAHEQCIAKQKSVLKKVADGAFYGACYAGAEEFVFPVDSKNKTVAFVSVSGYRSKETQETALKKLSALCEKYGFDENETRQKYKTLNKNKPDFNWLNAIIAPLCNSFSLLYLLLKDLPPEDGTYRKILAYLNAHYTEKITLQEIADACFYSPSYVRHTFKKHANETIKEYLTSLRIAHAKRLLKTTGLSVTDVAFTVGFDEPNYFTNVFKKAVGCSPKEFRRDE